MAARDTRDESIFLPKIYGSRLDFLLAIGQYVWYCTLYETSIDGAMKETPRRRITVTSSSKEISSDRLGKRVVVRTGRPLSKVLPYPNKGSRSCFLNILQLRDIS